MTINANTKLYGAFVCEQLICWRWIDEHVTFDCVIQPIIDYLTFARLSARYLNKTLVLCPLSSSSLSSSHQFSCLLLWLLWCCVSNPLVSGCVLSAINPLHTAAGAGARFPWARNFACSVLNTELSGTSTFKWIVLMEQWFSVSVFSPISPSLPKVLREHYVSCE